MYFPRISLELSVSNAGLGLMDPQGPVVVQHRIELREVDDAIAVDAWHLLIHQGYQGLDRIHGVKSPFIWAIYRLFISYL